MVFRIILLSMVSYILKYATGVFYHLDITIPPGISIEGSLSGKAVLLVIGGLFLIWKGVLELRHKSKGVEQEVKSAAKFWNVILIIVGMNLLFSVDSILTVVGMTDVFAVMVGSVVIFLPQILLLFALLYLLEAAAEPAERDGRADAVAALAQRVGAADTDDPGDLLDDPAGAHQGEARAAVGIARADLYPSLSKIARDITGTNWNGFLFFGLVKRGGSSEGDE